jgi:hypothetical protein
MSLLKRLATCSAQRPSRGSQSGSEAFWHSIKNLTWFVALIAIAGAFLSISPKAHVLAKTAQAAETNDTIDPDAIAAINRMSAYLRSLKTFQVQADTTNDDVLDDGQIVQNISKVNVLAAQPNRLRVEVTSDEKHRIFFYDGKNFTVWGRIFNYYATVPAPPTIGKLIEVADEKYDIELPLIDLFKWGNDADDVKKIKAAVDIGPSTIEGVTCEHYAFHQEGIDWQIWIQLGEFPLPRKLVIRTLTDDARPQHSDTLTWNLAPSFNDDAFVFDPPPDAKRIVLAEENTDATDKKQ